MAQTSPSISTEVLSIQSGSNGTSSASTMTSAAANGPLGATSTIAAGEEIRLCLGLLETLDQARNEYEVAMQQLKWVITRCRQSLELCGAQIQAQNQTQIAAIDLLADSLRRRLAEAHSGGNGCTVVDGHPNCPPSAKTDAACVGLPNTSQLSLSLFRRAVWQADTTKAKPSKARSTPSPVAPQVTGAVITPKSYFVPPPQRDREGSVTRSTRGKSDPLLRNILAAKPGGNDNAVLLTPSELMRNEWLKNILTAGNWKKTLEVAKSGTPVSDLVGPQLAAALLSERKRTSGGGSSCQQLATTTTTSGQTAQTETTGGETETGDPLSPMETELASGIVCFSDLLTPNVIDDLEARTTAEQENKQQQTNGMATLSYADRLATSVFEHLDSPGTFRKAEGLEGGDNKGECGDLNLRVEANIKSESSIRSAGEVMVATVGGGGCDKGENSSFSCEVFSLVKSPSPRPAVNIRGRTEPLVRGLMTSELLKRAYLLGRDDYLFFEWMSPSESQWESSAIFPYGAFRAEIIFNTANIEDVNTVENRDGDMLADETASSPDPSSQDQSAARSSRFDPLCAQLIFEVETRPLEQCTREACCKAFRQLMDWAEDRVTQLKLPSPMSVAAGRSGDTEGGRASTATSAAGGDDEWDGDFSSLSCLPLPQDYGRSELFDKRGSMRYIQLAATNPPIPVNMLDIKQKARNFNAWYTVQYGNGMWKAEVIVDQVNSKRNSFQRSLKQMSYQRAQLQVMRWLFKKCRDLKIATFRYKGRKDEYLVTVPPSSTAADSLGYTLLECPETKRRKLEEESPDLMKRRRQN